MEKACIALSLLMAVSLCSACTYIPTPAQSIVERMSTAKVAFKGKVQALHPWPTTFRWNSGFYNATFDAECVYKNELAGLTITQTMPVAMFGTNGAMCSKTDVELDETYVILAGDRSNTGALWVANINFQSGAEAVTQHVLDQVESVYTCTPM